MVAFKQQGARPCSVMLALELALLLRDLRIRAEDLVAGGLSLDDAIAVLDGRAGAETMARVGPVVERRLDDAARMN